MARLAELSIQHHKYHEEGCSDFIPFSQRLKGSFAAATLCSVKTGRPTRGLSGEAAAFTIARSEITERRLPSKTANCPLSAGCHESLSQFEPLACRASAAAPCPCDSAPWENGDLRCELLPFLIDRACWKSCTKVQNTDPREVLRTETYEEQLC